jgi:hypothetical protein
MTAPESMDHLAEVSEVYPLGVLVDRTAPPAAPASVQAEG